MGTNLLLRVMCVVLCPALALTGYVAISSCDCGCLDITPFTVCCCDAAVVVSETAALAESSDDCRVEMAGRTPPADTPSPIPSVSPVVAVATAHAPAALTVETAESLGGIERPSQLALTSSQPPRAPPIT